MNTTESVKEGFKDVLDRKAVGERREKAVKICESVYRDLVGSS